MSMRPRASDFMPSTGFGTVDLGPPALGRGRTDMAGQIDRLLTDGFRALRFPAELEHRFLHDTAADRLRVILISAALVVLLFNGFLLVDCLMIPDVFNEAVALRVGVFTPICLIGVYVQVKVPRPFFRELLVLVAGLLASAISLYLCCISKDSLAGPYLVNMAVIVMFSHAVSQMRFWLAVALDVAICMGLAVALFYVPSPPLEVMVPAAVVMAATITFTLFGCYTLERDERQNWLLRLRERNLLAALKSANERLDKISRCDLLTQVANRRHFDEFLAQVWERAAVDGTEVSLIMIDVDHFKAYNDHYGHPAGDECLRQVAGTLKRRLRRPGDLVARFGGEEFIAVLNGTALPIAMQAAERIRIALERLRLPHVGSPTSSFVTASMGVACVRPAEPGTSPTDLIAQADASLYRAKAEGRNRISPDPATGDPSA